MLGLVCRLIAVLLVCAAATGAWAAPGKREAIAKKREAEKTRDATKLAALPKMEQPTGQGQSDGNWSLTWKTRPGCKNVDTFVTTLRVANGAIEGHVKSGRVSGTVSSSGAVRFSMPAITDGAPMRFTGTLRGNSASGSFARPDGYCTGTFTMNRH